MRRWVWLGMLLAGCAGGPGERVTSAKPVAPIDAVRLAGTPRKELADREQQLRDRLVEDPGDAGAYFELAMVLQQQGKRYAARQVYERTLTLVPERADVHLRHGELLEEMADWPAAERAADRAIRLNSELGEAYALRGRLHRRAGRNQQAIDAFEAGWKKDPPSVSCGMELARFSLERGEDAPAADRLRLCLLHAPDYAPLRRLYADALERQGRTAEAIAQWQWLIDHGNGGAEAYFQLAELQHRRGQQSEALRSLAAGRRIEPDYPELGRLERALASDPPRPAKVQEEYRPLLTSRPTEPASLPGDIDARR